MNFLPISFDLSVFPKSSHEVVVSFIANIQFLFRYLMDSSVNLKDADQLMKIIFIQNVFLLLSN